MPLLVYHLIEATQAPQRLDLHTDHIWISFLSFAFAWFCRHSEVVWDHLRLEHWHLWGKANKKTELLLFTKRQNTSRVFPQLSAEGVIMTPYIWIKEGKQWILGVIYKNLGVKRNKGVMENPVLVMSKFKAFAFDNLNEARILTSGAVFTNHSLERSLSYSPEFSMYRSIWM